MQFETVRVIQNSLPFIFKLTLQFALPCAFIWQLRYHVCLIGFIAFLLVLAFLLLTLEPIRNWHCYFWNSKKLNSFFFLAFLYAHMLTFTKASQHTILIYFFTWFFFGYSQVSLSIYLSVAACREGFEIKPFLCLTDAVEGECMCVSLLRVGQKLLYVYLYLQLLWQLFVYA